VKSEQYKADANKHARHEEQADNPSHDRGNVLSKVFHDLLAGSWLQNIVCSIAIGLILLLVAYLVNRSLKGLMIGAGIGITTIFWVIWLTLIEHVNPARQSSPPNELDNRTTQSVSPKQPRFSERPSRFTIVAGSNRIDLPADVQPQFAAISETRPFSAHLSPDNRICVDADVYAGSNRPAITIRDNVIRGKPENWDRNSDDSAVEIVNEHGDPVFQLQYLDESSASLKGVFVSAGKLTVCDDSGQLAIGGLRSPIKYSLARLFKYPSKKFPGEREPIKKSVDPRDDKSLTHPTPLEIGEQLKPFGFSPPPDVLARIVGMRFKWLLVLFTKEEREGKTVLEFMPDGKGGFPIIDVTVTPELADASKTIDRNAKCTVEGVIDGAHAMQIRATAIAIRPIEVKNQIVIP
jgi:hypothetical protein